MKKAFVFSLLGGASQTARTLGISQPAVTQWSEDIPDSAIGRIARLRPDVLRGWWKAERKVRQVA
ncbi:hypothetical protein FNU76_19030 [Chitinimonas arctica]|uniref:Helix-turn-helix domain-containing protein n=1 Tax=Chitinimonas arctica TaxID=2594795 RepID=A0A516SJE3_9NEIS|nr:hypothetical protein FNU76_04260 [Chitinimonas arctica]QDQ28275.1 hypothetical protein FNU76_19030 [Chitinimonas arctica]